MPFSIFQVKLPDLRGPFTWYAPNPAWFGAILGSLSIWGPARNFGRQASQTRYQVYVKYYRT
jgi:hypothetical protein